MNFVDIPLLHAPRQIPMMHFSIKQTQKTTKEQERQNEHTSSTTTPLIRVNLLQPRPTLIQRPIDRSSDRQSAADNGADADEEAGEGL